MNKFIVLLTLLPSIVAVGCNCVAFKVSGVQDWWLNAVQIGVLNEFKTAKDAVSVGIIGGTTLFGSDPTLVQYLRNAKADAAWRFEIANNGKLYEDFSGQTLAAQQSLLTDSNANIKQVLSVTPKVFMPPMDSFDANTLTALRNRNFTHISAAEWSDAAPYPLSGQTLYRFPETCSMSGDGDVILNNATVFREISSSITTFGFAVVGVIPQYFAAKNGGNAVNSVENSSIGQLRAVISAVKAAGFRIVTISEINSQIQSTSPSSSAPAGSTSSGVSCAGMSAPASTASSTRTSAGTTRTSAGTSGTTRTSAGTSAGTTRTSAGTSASTTRTSTSAPTVSTVTSATRTSAGTSASTTRSSSSAGTSAGTTRTSAGTSAGTTRSSAPAASTTTSTPNPTNGVVCFRLDDIQDGWITAAQMEVIRIFRQENVPLSIGIISNMFGTDTDLVPFVRGTIGQTPRVEIVSHGVNHEDFTGFSRAQQLQLLTQSKTQIKAATGVDVDVFIPPYNAVNNDLFQALISAGYRVVSSEVDQDPAPYNFASKGIYRYPIQAATANDVWGIPASETMQQIRAQIGRFGFSVVMMHPQEYSNVGSDGNYENSVNTTMIQQLSLLLQTVKASGYSTVVLGDLPTRAPQ